MSTVHPALLVEQSSGPPSPHLAHPAIHLLAELISRPSVTPADEGCQQLLADRLTQIGFTCRHLRFGEVDNLVATIGEGAPSVMFVGHTDVVPVGDETAWTSAPFVPTVRGDVLFGRGTADMKGSIAAAVTSLETVFSSAPPAKGSVGLILTSDEEGPGIDGVKKVMAQLDEEDALFDAAVVIEPSSRQRLGDVLRVGRRGSLGGRVTVNGIQGHVAYPELARNPIHDAAHAMAELVSRQWDDGNAFFPPTSFQISNFVSGTGANNVIPGVAEIIFNFRFSTQVTPEYLRQELTATLDRHGLDYGIDWHLSGRPFLTRDSDLVDTVQSVIKDHLGIDCECSTGGGTSDGRWIAPYGIDVVELGPINASIHKIDEHVAIDDVVALVDIYSEIIRRMMAR